MRAKPFNKVFQAIGVVATLALLATGCGSDSTSDSPPAGGGTGGAGATDAPKLSGNVTVLAAASLKQAYDEIGKQFEAANPGVKITFSYGGSGDLAASITEGVPADVFASADEKSMKVVTDAKQNGAEPQQFAGNVLEIAVAAGNPKNIKGWADLANKDLTIAICANTAPCGRATEALEKSTGVTVAADTEEPDVKSVLSKVQLGEVDAGVVYHSDIVTGGDKIQGIEFPEADSAKSVYVIAPLSGSTNAEVAAAFVAFVMGPDGQDALKQAGFITS